MNVDYNTETQEITVELNTPAIEFDTPTGGRGLRGETGLPGRDGIDGVDGRDGLDGQDGISPTVSTSKSGKTTTVTITDAEGEKTATILDGNDGQDGQDGQDGEDGISPIITTSKSGKTTTITIVDADGTKTATILDGEDGASTWGDITGTLSNQTDLKNALDAKADVSSLATVATTGDYDDLIDKPTIPTKVSDLSNDLNFIDNTVNNLTNYYTSSNTYTKTEVDNLIGTVSSLNIEVVETLPTQDISTSTIYLVPKTGTTNDVYDEYIYVSNAWELIGSTQVDLTNYYTKTETDNLLDDKVEYIQTQFLWTAAENETQITTEQKNLLFSNNLFYFTWSNQYQIPHQYRSVGYYKDDVGVLHINFECGNKGYSFTINRNRYVTKSEYTKVNTSDLSTVATSGSYSDLTNKPTIPDELADLTDDSTHRVVTDTEKSTWSGKQDALVSGSTIKTINSTSLLGSGDISVSTFSGSYNDLTDKPTIPSVSALTDSEIYNYIGSSSYDPGYLALTDMSYMFNRDNSTTIDISCCLFNWTPITKSIHGFFRFCHELTTIIGLDTINTHYIEDFGDMFNYCSSLTELDLTSNINFDTSNATNMSGMFFYCSSLTELDLSTFDTSNVTDMSEMFRGCSSLTTLDISNFDFTNVTEYNSIFYGCKNDLVVYVKDQAAQDWILNLSSLDRPAAWTSSNVRIKV